MRKIKAWLRLLLGFSQTEANAFVILLPLMFIVIVSEPVYQTYFMYNKPDDFQDAKRLDSLIATWEWPEPERNKPDSTFRYRNKRTGFGARQESGAKQQFSRTPTQKYPASKKTIEKFDLNLADTTQLKTIYGIGPVIARRIVTYRSSLGGFIMMNQLHDVWGLDSTTMHRLSEKSVIAADFTPIKLPINHCGEQDLARHPYIRAKLARAIVNYRGQHGNFLSVEDLMKIALMDEKSFHRIKPYITID